ncbi:hypothetical protein R6Q59_035540 [Mikania micrantha]
MGDPFVSSKQPSLFPMTIPCIKISRDEYHIFYKGERSLIRILLVSHHREVVESTLVIGFLLWLERERYTSSKLARMFVNSLSLNAINQVADEVGVCISFMKKNVNNKSCNISHLQCFLDRKSMHLEDLYYNGDSIFHEVSCIANDVSVKAFDDILEPFIKHDEIRVMHHRMKANVVPPDDRTIFLTFSKGYPLSQNEIIRYFTSMFGDFIQSIHMQPVEPGIQPLFARIVVRCPSLVRAVVDRDGQHGKSKYIINGKHVWARKFVPRTQCN